MHCKQPGLRLSSFLGCFIIYMEDIMRKIRKRGKTKEKRSQEQQEHKCSGCPYGTWYGEKVYCPFMKCFYIHALAAFK